MSTTVSSNMKFTYSRTVTEEIELNIGDEISYDDSMNMRTSKGILTHVFGKGKKFILDDEKVIFISDVIAINGQIVR